MAIGAFVEGAPADGGEGYSGRVTPFVVLSCVVAGSGGVLFGYDLGISGSSSRVAPHFARDYFCIGSAVRRSGRCRDLVLVIGPERCMGRALQLAERNFSFSARFGQLHQQKLLLHSSLWMNTRNSLLYS